MNTDLVEKIAKKASNLPVEAQQRALEFVESLEREKTVGKKPFRSVKGVLRADLSNLERDLAEIRREAWGNFPREEPKQ
jgi:hypothetical protein